jgi:arginyl-tRNA synthetase
MLAQQKQDISALFQSALAPLLAGTEVVANVVLERPRDPSHGDVACNIAMQLAKQLKMNPRELATKVVDALLANPAQGLVESADIAGPGFINLRVSAAAKQAVVKAVLAQGAAFGSASAGAGKKSSSNSSRPTRPVRCT